MDFPWNEVLFVVCWLAVPVGVVLLFNSVLSPDEPDAEADRREWEENE